jgi:hypothetical protein
LNIIHQPAMRRTDKALGGFISSANPLLLMVVVGSTSFIKYRSIMTIIVSTLGCPYLVSYVITP